MWRFLWTLPVVAVALAAFGSGASHAQDVDLRGLSRAEIKEIPILERQHRRAGHFYGNTVRRRYSRGVSRFYDEQGQPANRAAQVMENRM